MSGRVQLVTLNQPTDHGTERNIDDSSVTDTRPASQPSCPFITNTLHPQPTGALHPATLTPISAPPSFRYHYSQPGSGHHHPRSAPLPSSGHSPPIRGTPPRPPSSAGLQGLADAAMMEQAQTRGSRDIPEERLLPRPVGFRPAYASQGKFWDDQLSYTRSRDSPTTAAPQVFSSSTNNPSSGRKTSTPSALTTSTTLPRLIVPTPHNATTSSATTSPTLTVPLPAKLPAVRKPATRPSSTTPHPLADIDLDREYNPPTVDEWEQRALKVLTLPPIPTSWYTAAQQQSMMLASHNATPPATAAVPTRQSLATGSSHKSSPIPHLANPTPPASALPPPSRHSMSPTITTKAPSPPSPISALPTSGSSTTSAKSGRPRRGGDRRPRATPHSSAWAVAATQAVPHDHTGRRIHPPPGGSIPPPPNSSTRSERAPSDSSGMNLTPPAGRRSSLADPGPPAEPRALSFEAHSTQRRASLRTHHLPRRGSDSVTSSRSSSRSGGDGEPMTRLMVSQDSEATLVGSQETSGQVQVVDGACTHTDHRAILQLNLQLQLQIQTERAGFKETIETKNQRIKDLETALNLAAPPAIL